MMSSLVMLKTAEAEEEEEGKAAGVFLMSGTGKERKSIKIFCEKLYKNFTLQFSL